MPPAGAVHGDDVDAAADELLDDEAADLAGAEDDVAGHDALLEWRRIASGRTAVRAVTTMAPLEPKTVNCSSTWTPAAVVIAQPSAQIAASASGQSEGEPSGPLSEDQRLALRRRRHRRWRPGRRAT